MVYGVLEGRCGMLSVVGWRMEVLCGGGGWMCCVEGGEWRSCVEGGGVVWYRCPSTSPPPYTSLPHTHTLSTLLHSGVEGWRGAGVGG